MTDSRQQLLTQLAAATAHIASLELDHARIVEASESSNADDEHDPEGATIAYERQLLLALLERSRRTRDDVEAALLRLDGSTYGRCQVCGQAIPAARLEVRPHARTCVGCVG